MTKFLHVLVVFDTAGPPANQDFSAELKTEAWKTEAHVIEALKGLGHRVTTLGLYDDASPLIQAVQQLRPDIIFNLAEAFDGESRFDRNIVGLFELLKIPYTGASPPSLMLCKNKGLTKEILSFHRIKTPRFRVLELGRPVHLPKQIPYPILVKPLREEASYGISQKSLVDNEDDLIKRIQYVHESMERDVIIEEFIKGRELYVSIVGNHRLTVFPLIEMLFTKMPNEAQKFATYKAKWDQAYRKRWGIESSIIDDKLDPVLVKKIKHTCKRVYRLLQIKGYGRIDLRLTRDGEVVIIEANPNPFIANDEDFAMAAAWDKCDYPQLIQRILTLGLEAARA